MNTTINLDDELVRIYSRENLFEPCERDEPRFWDDMKEADDERPGGVGLYFRIVLNSGHAVGNPAEGGDWSTDQLRNTVQGHVTAAQIDATVRVSSKFLEASKGEGSFGGDAEHEAIVEATTNLFDYASVLMGVGHGTGRLAIIETTIAVAATAIQTKAPERAFQLREGQPIDIVNTDTGGTVQSSTRILAIDYETGIITVEDPVTATAGWGIYQADVYGNPMPNGLRMIVDDGDFAPFIFGLDRSAASNNGLNAKIMDPGTLQEYSEELVNSLLDQIAWRQKKVPTELRCNRGIIGEHRRVTTADRTFMQTGSVPKYEVGTNHDTLAFVYGTNKIPFVQDLNLPARELYALHRPSWRKHTLRKADWERGKGGSILHVAPAAGGETYSHSYVGNIMMDVTVSCRSLNSQGALKNIRDRNAAADAAP